MNINKIQNNQSFTAQIGYIDSMGIAERLGVKTLESIQNFLPKVVKSDFADDTATFSYRTRSNYIDDKECLEVSCIKEFTPKLPERKSFLSKLFNKLGDVAFVKDNTVVSRANFSLSPEKVDEGALERAHMYAYEGCLKSPESTKFAQAEAVRGIERTVKSLKK